MKYDRASTGSLSDVSLDQFEVQVGNHHADVVTSELQVGQVPDLRRILFVAVVLLPTGLALVHQGTGRSLPVLVLLHEPTDLGRRHHVPAAVRTNHNELVSLLQLQVLDLRLGDETDPFGLQISQRTGDGDAWPFLIGPHSRRPDLLSLVRQPIYLAS